MAKAKSVNTYHAVLDERDRELISQLKYARGAVRFVSNERIDDWDKIKKMVTKLGGTWSRKEQGFTFPLDMGDIAERLAHAQETGELLDPALAGFFQTPVDLADKLVAKVNVKHGDRVLEPSAGHGAILDAVCRRMRWFPGDKDRCPVEMASFEVLADNARVLRNKGFSVMERDFLTVDPMPTFDCIPMNPPFSKAQDIAHVTHALKFLAPGGRLAAIMSSGAKFRMDKKAMAFRELISSAPYQSHTLDNPAGSFKASGTLVNTITVYVQKA